MSFGEFIAVSNVTEINSLLGYIVTALIICGINSLLVPFINWFFSKLISFVKRFQKTPENDGELADIVIDKLQVFQDDIDKRINNIAKNINEEQTALTEQYRLALKDLYDEFRMNFSNIYRSIKQLEEKAEEKVEEKLEEKVEEKLEENNFIVVDKPKYFNLGGNND